MVGGAWGVDEILFFFIWPAIKEQGEPVKRGLLSVKKNELNLFYGDSFIDFEVEYLLFGLFDKVIIFSLYSLYSS